MAVIKARKTKLIKAGIVGALISLLPSLVVCSVLLFFITKKNAGLEQKQSELSKYEDSVIYMLKEDVECGQILQPGDIEAVKGKLYSEGFSESLEYYVGKEMITAASAGTLLNSCVVREVFEGDNNMRRYYIDYVDIPQELPEGANFDVRIVFPNGEDYLVAGDKEMRSRDEAGFYLDLNRKEALLMSSARVDCSIYSGTKMYMAGYTTGFEAVEIQTYPVNKYVFELGQWEPNMEDTFDEEEFLRRETLEKNLLEFMGVANNLQ